MDSGSTLAAPFIVVEDTHGSVCNDVECSDDTLWTAEEFLLFEGTHKELLLCHENYGSGWKRLQIAGMHDDDEHFKRRSSKPQVLEETDGFEADVDSPISKTVPRSSVDGIMPPFVSTPRLTSGGAERFSTSSLNFDVFSHESEPSSRRTSISSTFSAGGTKIPKHYSVALELLHTEQTYCKGLWLIEKVRAEASATNKGHSILPDEAMREVFLNIGQIYFVNSQLLRDLDDRMRIWEEKPHIGDIMAAFAPYFKMYSSYSAGFASAQVAYARWLDKKKAFAELVKKTEAGALCGGLPFSSYFLTPIQRIPRYKLLLQEYLKYLPADSEDRENAKKALSIIAEAAEGMNQRIKELKKQAKVVEVSRKLEGDVEIVVPGREFLGRGPLDVSDSKGGGKIKQCVLFLIVIGVDRLFEFGCGSVGEVDVAPDGLVVSSSTLRGPKFSDIMVVAKLTANGRYKMKHKLSLHGMTVQPLQSAAFTNAFQVTAKEEAKVFQFSARCDSDRARWLGALEEAISRNERRRSTLQLEAELPEVPMIKDPHIKSAVESMSVSPTLTRHKSLRRKFSMRRKAMQKVRWDAEETDSGNASDISTEFYLPGKAGDRTSKDLDTISTNSSTGIIPGLDNKLSGFLRQKAHKNDEELWVERWYVLNSHSLVCYSGPEDPEPVAAISLTGYCVSMPTLLDGIKEPHVIKLYHPRGTKRTFYLQLPSEYHFHKWLATLQELCECDVNKYGLDD